MDMDVDQASKLRSGVALLPWPPLTLLLLALVFFFVFILPSYGPFSTPINISANLGHASHPASCDFSLGKWVTHEAFPLYSPGFCPYVDKRFSCQTNGRPDTDYMRWRWMPHSCDIPRFNATDMLERLRGKRLVFVGDSVNRNQWESLLCMLREGVGNKSRIQGQRIRQAKKAHSFNFLDYDCKVEFFQSHFLAAEGKRSRDGAALTLRLDAIDRSAREWSKADVLVFNAGHWFVDEKTNGGKNFFQEGDTVHPNMSLPVAFRKALNTWAEWADRNVNPKTTQVFFRSYSPSHFRGGRWNSGGRCHTETQPIFNLSHLESQPIEEMLIVEDVIRRMKISVSILNVTRLSDFRKDAHPSVYGQTQAVEDCGHWCLPGVPDVWNQLLYASLVMRG